MKDSGTANPDLIYTKDDDVAYFFEEEFDVEVLLDEGQKAKATKEAWVAKPGNAAKKKAYNKLPENVVKRKAYNKAYGAKRLVKRFSDAWDRLEQSETSESAEQILRDHHLP